MNSVEIVTIKNKIPLFKGEEQANAIELIELEELGYELVANKTLYQIGDKAVLIQPDYCLSDISLFKSFIRPINRKTGIPDESISMLGKVGGLPRRIRAKKFNLSKVPNGDPVYSNGILLPRKEVADYIWKNDYTDDNLLIHFYQLDLTKELDITKYEEPEHTNKYGIKTGASKIFPEGVYKTDEENINNLWNNIEKNIGYPITLVGTEKVDGSSITIGIRNKEGFICSRNLLKPLTIKKHKGRRKKTLLEYLMFWSKPDLNLYEEVRNEDDFVKYGTPLLNKLLASGEDNTIFRAELNGGSLKGSGNKNNPASKEPTNIKIFGVDYIVNGIAKKVSYDEYKATCKYYDLPTVREVFNKEFNSKEEILQECNQYFKENMIEGIVVRTLDSQFSAKIMNLEYDSKK